MARSQKVHRLTQIISNVTGWLGSFPIILVAFAIVGAWFVGGLFVAGGYGNNTYQLLINTGTTIVTFLMVFIIQNTQNREGRAMQVKMDALLELLDDRLDSPEVDSLIGVEDKPEKIIKAEQDRVREPSGNDKE